VPKKARKDTGGADWERKIAAYDEECRERERAFLSHHVVITDKKHERLTEEENVVFNHLLNGVTCEEMAKEIGIETSEVVGIIEIIRAKLSIED